MIYNFRIDRSCREDIINRIKTEKTLSQGWGGGDYNLSLEDEDFVNRCYEHYKLNSTRIPTNLTRIREFKDNDIIVVPHLPEDRKVTFLIVDEDYPNCYEYVKNDKTHQNHRIKIKEVYGLEGNVEIYNEKLVNWYGKLQWMRLPILPIDKFSKDINEIIDNLRKNPSLKFKMTELDEYLLNKKDELVNKLKEDLRKINASNSALSFEKICEKIIKDNGYEIKRRNVYDKTGGDIDLECIRNRNDISPFESGEVKLFVQIKKHKGETDEYAVKQVSKFMDKNPEADGCVMTLADKFSDNAIKEANEKKYFIIKWKRSM
ncbi:restriction endonuclease [Thermohalobacter berrensis]|uniref:Restriction endonuclease type IV Mrr domain-containing protein n=1 Tax=Thermohalobacter berrensis TaxID=99594 RepID=A0A419T9N0_9FIRM|nr:restriction endonuclease [Thermohalobacter berrensis]RKD34178.1 hypothetical protein BET03_07765 [Thermohalobacter berrensis]